MRLPATNGSPQDICVVQVKHARTALANLAKIFFEDPSSELTLIGATGTNGKTTLTYLCEAILKQANKSVGVIGTIEYRFAGDAIKASHTTPESTDLLKLLTTMKAKHVSHVAMEVSSHALNLHRVDSCAFDVGVLTNISHDHLDYHDSMADYKKAKSLLFELMSKQDDNKIKTAVINGDDKNCLDIANDSKKYKKLRTWDFWSKQRQ